MIIYNKLTKWSPIAGSSRQRRDGTFDSISCWNPIHQIYTFKDTADAHEWSTSNEEGRLWSWRQMRFKIWFRTELNILQNDTRLKTGAWLLNHFILLYFRFLSVGILPCELLMQLFTHERSRRSKWLVADNVLVSLYAHDATIINGQRLVSLQ